MIRVRSLRNGGIQTHEGIDALRRAADAPEPDWISVVGPDEAEIRALSDRLGLHPLSVRDVLGGRQAPKLEDFGEHVFFLVHTPAEKAWTETRRIGVFLGKSWIVTLQPARSSAMDRVAQRVEQDPEHLLASADTLAHEVIDQMTVGFEGLTADLFEKMNDLEERILRDPTGDAMQAILGMRRRVMGLLRVTRSQRDVCGSLCRLNHPVLGDPVKPYLRDVYDHVLRVFELLETAREGLVVMRDAHLAVVNNRLSEVMRTLTIIATVMMPLSLVAGIYGMNFDVLPGKGEPLGFWITTGLMVLIAGGMLAFFKRRRWF